MSVPRENPARLQYDMWLTMLTHLNGGPLEPHRWTANHYGNHMVLSSGWGPDAGSIYVPEFDAQDRPVIAFGLYKSAQTLKLDADGTFQIRWMWGWKQRMSMARATFL